MNEKKLPEDFQKICKDYPNIMSVVDILPQLRPGA
jgi:hypothetical protein